jgi:hypothetical protein
MRTLIFQVINPPSGMQTATVSWTGSMNADVGVITVSNADQATPVTNGTFTAAATNPTPATSLTITSNPGDLTASVAATTGVWANPYTNQLKKWGIDSSDVGGDIGPGTGTTTHTWTDTWANTGRTVSGANFKTSVTTPDFTMSSSPSSQTVTQGGSTTYSLTITPTGGFGGTVNLSVSGLPSGATGTFSPNPATGSSTLTVTTSATTPGGSYTLTLTGTSGALTHSNTVSLVVNAPNFALGATPSNQTVQQGGSTTYNVTITPSGGFTSPVNLSISGLPSGATGTFSSNPATTTSTLTITTNASTPVGSSTLTITGTGGGLTNSTTVSLTVTSTGVLFDNAVSSGFKWGVTSATTPSFLIGSGANRAAMIMVTMTANNATNITASLGGVSATLVAGTDSGTAISMRTLIFQVINPPSGMQTATVSWTGSMNADVGVITVSNADQTTPVTNGTFTAAATNSTPATSLTITSNPGDLTATVATTTGVWATPYTNQLKKWGIDSSDVGGDIGPGTGTTTHTWTDTWANPGRTISGANFKAHP